MRNYVTDLILNLFFRLITRHTITVIAYKQTTCYDTICAEILFCLNIYFRAYFAINQLFYRMRELKYHEKKLLKKTDFLDWKNEENIREVKILRRYFVQNRNDLKS